MLITAAVHEVLRDKCFLFEVLLRLLLFICNRFFFSSLSLQQLWLSEGTRNRKKGTFPFKYSMHCEVIFKLFSSFFLYFEANEVWPEAYRNDFPYREFSSPTFQPTKEERMKSWSQWSLVLFHTLWTSSARATIQTHLTNHLAAWLAPSVCNNRDPQGVRSADNSH